MLVGGSLGILFVTLLRRVMVEDPDLPFPESVAASEIHNAGQQGSQAAQLLFSTWDSASVIYLLGQFNLFSRQQQLHGQCRQPGHRAFCALGGGARPTWRWARPPGSPRRRSARPTSAWATLSDRDWPRLNFAGGVIAWGLLVPLLYISSGPHAD